MVITKSEIKKQIGIILIAIGAFFIASDIKEIYLSKLGLSGIVFGLILISLALYFFKMNG